MEQWKASVIAVEAQTRIMQSRSGAMETCSTSMGFSRAAETHSCAIDGSFYKEHCRFCQPEGIG